MADLPERFRALDERAMTVVGHRTMRESRMAVQRSIPTMHHACRVFERAREILGESAWEDPVGGDARRLLYRVDEARPAWRVASEALSLTRSGADGTWTSPAFRIQQKDVLLPEDAPEGWTWDDPPYLPTHPQPEIVPRSADMVGGTLSMREGAAHYDVAYNGDGLFAETVMAGGDVFHQTRYGDTRPFTIPTRARPPALAPISLLCRADLDAGGHAVDVFAEMVADNRSVERVPGRVLLPLPVPGGLASVWARGLSAMRKALWEGTIPHGARALIVDGFASTAIAWGHDLDDAHARWMAEVERVRPRPPVPEKPAATAPVREEGPERLRDDAGNAVGFSLGTVRLRGPSSQEIPWPLPLPKHVPAVAVPLAPLNERVPEALAALGFTEGRRVLGALGECSIVWYREEPDGWVLVGDQLADLIDPATFDTELVAIERSEREWWENETPQGWHIPWRDPQMRFELRGYSFWDGEHERVGKWRAGPSSWSPTLDAGSFDGDSLRTSVTQMRRLR